MFRLIKNGRKQIAAALVLTGLLSIESLLASRVVAAPQAPILVAQSMNDRIATLQCGQYTITIAFVGPASSNTYSYRTRGLFLQNGERQNGEKGDEYVFYNSDYEYRVAILEGGSDRRNFGTATLQVSHYGERILTKQCTWT